MGVGWEGLFLRGLAGWEDIMDRRMRFIPFGDFPVV